MIVFTEQPDMIERLLLSGWERGQEAASFYWPGYLPLA